jgi:hypothetical protein
VQVVACVAIERSDVAELSACVLLKLVTVMMLRRCCSSARRFFGGVSWRLEARCGFIVRRRLRVRVGGGW